MAWLGDIGISLSNLYQSFLAILPLWLQTFVNLFLLVIVVFIYSVFVWKIHKLVANKNIEAETEEVEEVENKNKDDNKDNKDKEQKPNTEEKDPSKNSEEPPVKKK